ncbi:hypothetical protein HF086_005211 [Spodoptera exigua]|uniref:C2H2-type domain-containing protein n=1 Tax=Spodoptera exigua TaxID=7107 RepID=A0A922N0D4_SPOEX|nr:hypothetical protein HF086_005211 [Spodoptera exigua]
MAAPNKPLKFDKICRACLEIKKDMRPLFEQLTATMLMGITKVQKEKLLNMNCQDTYMQYMEVPLTNANQILDGFFAGTPEQTPTNAPEQETKIEFVEVEKMVLFQATATMPPGRHVCNLCHKEFKHARWLKQHMRSHTNWIKANCKKPHLCPICDRVFKVSLIKNTPIPSRDVGSGYVENAHAYARTASSEAANVFGVPADVPQQDVAVPAPADSLRAEDPPVFCLRQAVLQRVRPAVPHGATSRGAALRVYHVQQELLQPY